MNRTLLAVALALGMTTSSSALACSCLAPTIEASYNNSDHALVGRALQRRTYGNWTVYDFRVVRDLTDCTRRGDVVRVATPNQQVQCGTSFQLGDLYVLFSNDQPVQGAMRWTTTYCSYNQRWADLTVDERDFLRTREVSCGGTDTCGDPSVQRFSCTQDPCVTAPACPGATCEANTCGGCNAEYYDNFGYAACVP